MFFFQFFRGGTRLIVSGIDELMLIGKKRLFSRHKTTNNTGQRNNNTVRWLEHYFIFEIIVGWDCQLG